MSPWLCKKFKIVSESGEQVKVKSELHAQHSLNHRLKLRLADCTQESVVQGNPPNRRCGSGFWGASTLQKKLLLENDRTPADHLSQTLEVWSLLETPDDLLRNLLAVRAGDPAVAMPLPKVLLQGCLCLVAPPLRLKNDQLWHSIQLLKHQVIHTPVVLAGECGIQKTSLPDSVIAVT